MTLLKTVPPEGSLNSKVAFIGEAPASQEIITGRPFMGQAGEQFNRYLQFANLIREECYITNVFKEVVAKKKVGQDEHYYSREGLLFTTKLGFTDIGLRWKDLLFEELHPGKFNVLVPMGNAALCALTGRKKGITKLRGSILYNELLNTKVIPTIHPAAALRQYMYRHYIIHDFKRVKVESHSKGLNLPKRNYIIKPSLLIVRDFLTELKKARKLTAFDIEVVNEEVSCISFSNSPSEAICIPFVEEGAPYFPLDQEAEVWILIGELLEDASVPKIAQNAGFDTAFLYAKYGLVTCNCHDTMIMSRLSFPDYPAKLEFLTSMHTREPYYKDDRKKHGKIGGNESIFREYNAKDSVVLLEIAPALKKSLLNLDNIDTYLKQVSLLQPTVYMGQRGLLTDTAGMRGKLETVDRDYKHALEELREIVGADLNPHSPEQVMAYFYVRKKVKPYYKNRRMTADEGALKRIARKGFPEARLILRLRNLAYMRSHYLKVKLRNKRLVCSYDPCKKTARLGSSEDILGYGSNMQNQPAWMNEFFVADLNYLIYEVDLSQADNRSVAYIAPEERMIQAFENGEDVHALTASLIFGIPEDEIKEMHKKKVKADIGYGDQTHRFWGKKANHELNYGMGYRTFSFQLEIPESQGKYIYNQYHRAYPGIKQHYHEWVKKELSYDRRLTNGFRHTYLFLDRWGDQLFNQAYAFIPQSHTAHVINRRGIIPLYFETDTYRDVDLLRQVHDSINFQLPINSIHEHIRVLMALKESLEQPITFRRRTFKIPAEFKVGYRLDPMKELDFEGDLEEQLKEFFKQGETK